MTSGTQNQLQLELTPQEAEAVLELWARKQAEGELRSRLNVQDLAEATGLSQAEIEKLVATVRAAKATAPAQSQVHPPLKKAKPVNYFLIATAVVVWIAILFSVAVLAYGEGESKGRRMAVAFAPPALSGIPMPEAVAGIPMPADTVIVGVPSVPDFPYEQLPSGMRLQAEGRIVEGKSPDIRADFIRDAMKSFAQSVAPARSNEVIELDAKQIDLMLQPNQPVGSAIIKFVKLTGAGPKGRPFELYLPFPTKRNAMLEAAAEVSRSKQIELVVQESTR